LGVINEQISTAELTRFGSGISDTTLVTLKTRAEKIKDEIRENVSQLYNLGNTIEGLPVSKLLNDWITNVIEFEDTKAGMQVLADELRNFRSNTKFMLRRVPTSSALSGRSMYRNRNFWRSCMG
jgi:hypothetical protein